MPFRNEKHAILDMESIYTDTQAETWLPPYLLAHTTYADCRAQGLMPREALHQVLEIWRELQISARPVKDSFTAPPAM